MANLESTRQIEPAAQRVKVATIHHVSVWLRLWHWLDGSVVIALLLTYLLRATLLSGRTNADIFTEQLASHQIAASREVVRDLAHGLVDRLWTWHEYLGYALTALLIFRALIFVREGAEPFATAVRGWRVLFSKSHRAIESAPEIMFSGVRPNPIQNILVKNLYALFYVLQVVIVGTGLVLAFDDFLKEKLNVSKSTFSWMHSVHEYIMWFFLGFVIVHVIGVVVAECSNEPGLVSRMINGGSARDGQRATPAVNGRQKIEE